MTQYDGRTNDGKVMDTYDFQSAGPNSVTWCKWMDRLHVTITVTCGRRLYGQSAADKISMMVGKESYHVHVTKVCAVVISMSPLRF